MLSHWAYILVGDNNTGKTSFQRELLSILCNAQYKRLPTNIVTDIVHPKAPRHLQKLFTINRSYQEKASEYGSVDGYFKNYFKDADVCILSSHSHTPCIDDIREMIQHLQRRCYNVAGVFWENDFKLASKEISELNWQERIWIANRNRSKEEQIQAQITERASRFADMIMGSSIHR